MNLGKKFAIANVTLSSVMLLLTPLFLLYFFDEDYSSIDYTTDGFKAGLFIYFMGIIASIVMGILTLCLVKGDKTKNRGLQISNGIVMILFIFLPLFTTIAAIVISAILIAKESENK